MEKIKKENISNEFNNCDKVIGLKQVVKHAAKEELRAIYLASDVDAFIKTKVLAVAKKNRIPVKNVDSMVLLGENCGIDVGAACVGILTNEIG